MTRNYKSEAPSILSEFLFQTKNLVKEVLVTLQRNDLIETGNTYRVNARSFGYPGDQVTSWRNAACIDNSAWRSFTKHLI